MRIAQREGCYLAFDVGTVTDAYNIQFAGESARDALDGVRRLRAREPMQSGVFIGGTLQFQLAIRLLDGDPLRDRHRELALGPGHFQLLADLHFHAARQQDRLFPNSRHNPHQTRQRISPPTCSLWASRPVITPRAVVRMLIPIPPNTRGISVWPTYTRHPGRETRSIVEITGELSEPYFR